jgi:hypothetical protein
MNANKADKTLVVRRLREEYQALSKIQSTTASKKTPLKKYIQAETIASLLADTKDFSEASERLQVSGFEIHSFLEIAKQLIDSIEGENYRTKVKADSREHPYQLLCLVMLEYLDFLKRERPNLFSQKD